MSEFNLKNHLKQFDSKYNFESIMQESELEMMETDGQIESLIEMNDQLEKNVDLLNQASLTDDPSSIPETIETVMESLRGIKEDLKSKGFDVSCPELSLESFRVSPYSALDYSFEDITDVIKSILIKIKEFLQFVGRHIVNLVKKVGWMLLDIPGDAKTLLAKFNERVGPGDRLNEQYGEILNKWIRSNYPSLFYLCSGRISKYPGASGLSKIIQLFGVNKSQLEIPDVILDLRGMSVGVSSKFGKEFLQFFASSGLDQSDVYFSNERAIKDNIISIEGMDINDYEGIEVLVYCVDAKYIYYMIVANQTDGKIKTIISKARIETFRAPQIKTIEPSGLEANLIVNNSPLGYCSALLEEIINNSSRVHKAINRIPGEIKKLESILRDTVSSFESKGQSGDIVVNLKSYSRFLKGVFRNYYKDIMYSRLNTYHFYYKFSSVVFASVIGSKSS